MALTQANIKLKVVMDRDASGVPVFTFQDTTDYDTDVTDFAFIKAALKIEYISNGSYVTYYNNIANISTDPDISGASAGQANEDLTRARTQSTAIQLPRDSNDNVISGKYRFTYTVLDTNTSDDVTSLVSVDATFITPTGVLDSTVSLNPTAPSIVVTDDTNYVVQNITPTGTPTLKLYYPADSGASATSVTASSLTVTTLSLIHI